MTKYPLYFLYVLSYLIVILSFGTNCIADDTIVCPDNQPKRNKLCKEKKDFTNQAEVEVAQWEHILGTDSIVLMPWQSMDQSQFGKWKKPEFIKTKNKTHKVYGVFFDKKTNVVYLAVVKGVYFLKANEVNKGDIAEADRQFFRGQANSDKLKKGNFSEALQSMKHELMLAYIFMAQCCGYRWTTEGHDSASDTQQGVTINSDFKHIMGQDADGTVGKPSGVPD